MVNWIKRASTVAGFVALTAALTGCNGQTVEAHDASVAQTSGATPQSTGTSTDSLATCTPIDFTKLKAAANQPGLAVTQTAVNAYAYTAPARSQFDFGVLASKAQLDATGFPTGLFPDRPPSTQYPVIVEHGAWDRSSLAGVAPVPGGAPEDHDTYQTLIVVFDSSHRVLSTEILPQKDCFVE